ncbi:DUF1772-domain-containing protein [Aspergillus uvarum CBS 121591]|uniref:DUF1772-domain-containing protein n=1 Tax=Aspergillus uvarum CBS 121591 TaxID=1448315 RepID=A0A319CRZ6_9EURO|nr:DUF1772-domain-containing protein [Aspergillus uvarum CBS 121591]PYH87001.1 DUF1772-domain-containing protein [Aspergillus uvarum CBS 121591]
MTTNPLAYRTAQAIGFTGAAWLSGNIASQSLITIPALLAIDPDPDPDPTPTDHPNHMTATLTTLQIWKRIYTASSTQNPPVAAGTAAAFVYLAWTVARAVEPPLLLQVLSSSSRISGYAGPGWWYAAAAVLTVGVVPYTAVVMRGTNWREREREKGAEAEAEAESTSGLLKRWAVLNAVRSLLPLVGGLCGFAAAVI